MPLLAYIPPIFFENLVLHIFCSAFLSSQWIAVVTLGDFSHCHLVLSFVLESCAMCLLDMLFGLDCWVWESVVQLVCVLCSFLGSDYGFFFPIGLLLDGSTICRHVAFALV
uniref:Uncharacterized protein n=1 Tax=Opuntia streptacantha TaxID=393608 RepID=A0A7C9E966_OPUST